MHQTFIDMIQDHSLDQIVNVPTRDNNILDLIFTNVPDKVNRLVTLPPLGTSDHDIVFAEFDISLDCNRKAPRKTFKFHKANWEEIKIFVYDKLSEFSDYSDTEHMWQHFRTTIQLALEKYMPVRRTSGKRHIPWITFKVRKSMNKRDRFYKIWKHHKSARNEKKA